MFPRLKMSYLLIGLHRTERLSPALCGTGKKKRKCVFIVRGVCGRSPRPGVKIQSVGILTSFYAQTLKAAVKAHKIYLPLIA